MERLETANRSIVQAISDWEKELDRLNEKPMHVDMPKIHLRSEITGKATSVPLRLDGGKMAILKLGIPLPSIDTM